MGGYIAADAVIVDAIRSYRLGLHLHHLAAAGLAAGAVASIRYLKRAQTSASATRSAPRTLKAG